MNARPLIRNRIGRKVERKSGILDVERPGLEQGVKPSAGRLERLEVGLVRLARFAGVERVVYPET
ncbi:MAG: hypothetical protein K0M60_03060 [Hydrogenophaga sp.]|nr:hypothetical protein [Hydrogenophaga sp.]